MTDTIRLLDGTTLRTHRWIADKPRMTVALIHGYAEHCARYGHVAATFNRAGISLVGADLRGHGRSSGQRGHVMQFTDYHLDIAAILALAKEAADGGPVALLGHSMGGLLSFHYGLVHDFTSMVGLVVSSPLLGVAVRANPLKIAAGRVTSRVLPRLSLPSGLNGADACHDPQLAEAYDEDPLVFRSVNSRWYTEALHAIDFVFAHVSELRVPTLLLYAGADRIASAHATDRFARLLTMQDRQVERLEGYAHEIFNEVPATRTRVIGRVVEWLLAHGQRAAG